MEKNTSKKFIRVNYCFDVVIKLFVLNQVIVKGLVIYNVILCKIKNSIILIYL
jgi:hypothetical protein